ncbi:IDEAL domain-containing protein [Niallia sp. FSL K6-0212]|uniref:IDEAL domain-containing protein n=1 Tax=Niallia sp. FSL K6-0212 TaxID=2921423 RepID=UPI0030F9A1AD
MDQLKIGDWVKVKAIFGIFMYGYVTRIHGSSVDVKITKGPVAELNEHTFDRHRVQPWIMEEKYIDYDSLIDLALLTHDEEWFRELTRQKELLVKES